MKYKRYNDQMQCAGHILILIWTKQLQDIFETIWETNNYVGCDHGYWAMGLYVKEKDKGKGERKSSSVKGT